MKNLEAIRELAGRDICECGRKHRMQTGEIILEEGALRALPEVVRRYGHGGAVRVVCDENTLAAAGRDALNRLQKAGIPAAALVFSNGVAADERAVERMRTDAADAGCLVAAGSGTIHDICRYAAARTGAVFLSLPTAPSVDGFVSSVAAMTFGGCKATSPAVPPAAVVADTDVLAHAPRRLIAAGAGDILGKFTCLCDWEISSLVTSETFCRKLAAIETQAARDVLQSCGELARGGREAVNGLMNALLASGLAMQLNGDSRPASGAEHHLSHFWEMRFLREGRAPALHGAKVGVATVIMADIYHRAAGLFRSGPLRWEKPEITRPELEEVFGPAAKGVERENEPDPFAAVDRERTAANRLKIAELLDALPAPQDFSDALGRLGGPVTPADLGIDDALADEGLRYCIYVRRRMTLLRLLRMLRPQV